MFASIWKSDEKLLIFSLLILFLKSFCVEANIYQAFKAVFHHQMKHLEVRQKYSAACRIFNILVSVSYGGETMRLVLDILLQTLRFSIKERMMTK